MKKLLLLLLLISCYSSCTVIFRTADNKEYYDSICNDGDGDDDIHDHDYKECNKGRER